MRIGRRAGRAAHAVDAEPIDTVFGLDRLCRHPSALVVDVVGPEGITKLDGRFGTARLRDDADHDFKR